MAISPTKIRGFIAGVFAVTVLILGASFATQAMGWTIPGLSHIANALGFPGPSE
jgi:hypothetical protein